MSAKTVKFPKNWNEVREKVNSSKITVSKAIEELGISRSEYYKLKKLEETETDEEISPKDYFDDLKSQVKELNSEELEKTYANASVLMETFKQSGQEKAMNKMNYIMETLVKEYELYNLGVTTFVYRQDIERFIEKVEKKVVKCIEFSRYERPVPPEITEVVNMTKDIFDELLVVFTDYTGEVEKEVEKERREKDPILFGYFVKNRKLLSDRLYFLGDWVDEYCDLTLDSLVNEMKDISGEEIAHELKIEYNQNELKDKIAKTVAPEEDPKIPEDKVNDAPENPPYRELNIGEKAKVFFAKVRTILSRKK